MVKTRDLGFTLVEALVSITVIAILIGILVPAIAKSLDRSKELGSAVNLRSIGQVIEMYTGDNSGRYPAPTPGVTYPTYAPGAGKTVAHWQTVDEWPFLLAQSHPWWEYESMYLAPGASRITTGLVVAVPKPSFEYSASFLGSPEIWSDRKIRPEEWPGLVRSVAQQAVRFPAQKAMMWDVEMPSLRRLPERDGSFNLKENTPMLFADQHVTKRVPAEGTEPVINPAPWASNPFQRLHNTRYGVQGRDY